MVSVNLFGRRRPACNIFSVGEKGLVGWPSVRERGAPASNESSTPSSNILFASSSDKRAGPSAFYVVRLCSSGNCGSVSRPCENAKSNHDQCAGHDGRLSGP